MWPKPILKKDGIHQPPLEVERTTTQGSIHDPVPVPEGEGWVREYNYQVGKVSEAGESPSRSVKSRQTP